MWKPEEPNGRFGRWGQVASAMTTFAILAFVIVYVILYWLVGAPTWILLAACAPIAVFAVAWGFTVVEDDEPEPIASEESNSDRTKIAMAEPSGMFGRLGQVVVTVWSICVVMGLLNAISTGVFDSGVREWDAWIQLTVFMFVCVVAFLFEMTTLGEDDDDGPNRTPRQTTATADSRN